MNRLMKKPPKTIIRSVVLLLLSYLIGLLDLAVVSLFYNTTFERISVQLISILVAAFICALLLLRKNWIRILVIALLVIGLPLSVLPMLSSFILSPLLGFSILLQMLLQIAGVVLLLTDTSSRWYNGEEEAEK